MYGRTLLVLLVAIALAACAAPAPAVPPTAPPPPATSAPAPAQPTAVPPTAGPKKGGTITMAIWQEPEHLNWELGPQTVLGDIADMWAEGLLSTNEKGEWFPVLATEVPTTANGGISADGKTITYHLRKGVKWQDGTDFSCADLQFTLQVIRTPNTGTLHQALFADVDNVECPDPNTAVIHMKNFFAAWLTLFNGNYLAYIFPKSAGKPEDIKNWAYNRKPIGTGPFMVTEFVTGDHLTLVKNPTYWQPDKPYLDKVVVRIVPSSEVAMQLMKSGEADLMWNNTEADLPALAQMSNVTVFSALQPGGERLILNSVLPGDPADNKTPHPILGDVKVRQAIAYGIDKKTIIDKLL